MARLDLKNIAATVKMGAAGFQSDFIRRTETAALDAALEAVSWLRDVVAEK